MTETMDVKRAGHRVHLGQDTLLLHLRAVACGIDEAELRALGRQARNRTSWSEGLAALAGRCRESAVAAQSGGRPGDAGPLWRRAAACYHFASLFLEGGAQRACRDECRRAYACFSSLIDPPCRRVEIPFGGGVLPAYVRDAGGDGGWVVMVGALDMCKEVEGHRFAEAFVERGLSVLAFDGPGQGELADATTMRADYETVVGAVLDFIGDDRVGVFGASLGGYLAVRAAAMDPRIAACISFYVVYLVCGVSVPHRVQPRRRPPLRTRAVV